MMQKMKGLAAIATVAMMAGAPAMAADYVNDEASLEALKTMGEPLYQQYCAVCHGANGEGGGGPGIDGTAFMAGRSAVIFQILFGATDHGMPPFGPLLNDEQIAAIATFTRNSWSNDHGIVLPRSVELRRTQE